MSGNLFRRYAILRYQYEKEYGFAEYFALRRAAAQYGREVRVLPHYPQAGRRRGGAVVLVSSGLPGFSGRVVVMHEGRAAAIFLREQFDPQTIMTIATGQYDHACV